MGACVTGSGRRAAGGVGAGVRRGAGALAVRAELGLSASEGDGEAERVVGGRGVGCVGLDADGCREVRRGAPGVGVSQSLHAVPRVAGRWLAGLPRALEPGVAQRVVDSCDRATPIGRRDFAILLLLWRLALRRGEVAAMQLEDVRAAGRVGVSGVTAHRLRHTAATDMLREGASLTEIGQVLRHRQLQTTAIYAKADIETLRSLARP